MIHKNSTNQRKCCFIIPYFGNLPENFQIFLDSCAYNEDFTWMIFTDDNTNYNYPENVIKIYMKFDTLKELIQSKFDFPIFLDKPYKLCDYKPAYGYIFEEYLENFRFWGHCDCDVIFGHLSHFICDSLLDKYDKLFVLGHCTIYRNEPDINRVFMKPFNGKIIYKQVYSSEKAFAFDEEYFPENVNTIFRQQGYSVLEDDYSANLMRKPVDFRLTRFDKVSRDYLCESKKRSFFVYDHGVLKRYSKRFNRLVENEYMYIHFQNRKMENKLKDKKHAKYKIVPNRFTELEFPNVTENNFIKIKKKYYNHHRICIFIEEIKFWKRKIRNKIFSK